jgi:type VI secretion system activator RovC-like protein
VALNDCPCIRQVVIGPDHVEYLLVRTSKRSLTIGLTGHRATQGPVCLTFHVPARSANHAAAYLAWYRDLLAMKPRWIKRTRSQVLIRDALVAVDGREAGASHREVAEAIVGHKRVREEWSARGGWLKGRMGRALAVGQALCGGGHRKYIEQAYRFAA